MEKTRLPPECITHSGDSLVISNRYRSRIQAHNAQQPRPAQSFSADASPDAS